jgi:hypothetical protein
VEIYDFWPSGQTDFILDQKKTGVESVGSVSASSVAKAFSKAIL